MRLLVVLTAGVIGCGADDRETAARAPTVDPSACVVGTDVRGDASDRDPDRLRRECDRRSSSPVRKQPLPAPGDPRAAVGRGVVMRAGCLACHRIAGTGHDGPGPDLSDIGDRLTRAALRRTLLDPAAPMPSFASLPAEDLRALVAYLGGLRRE